MFGRKPKPVDTKEFEMIKDSIIQTPAPQENLVTITPLQPSVDLSPYRIVRSGMKMVDKFVWSQSGQQIKTGEQESVEVLENVCILSLDDVLEIVTKCETEVSRAMLHELKSFIK